MTPKVSVIIPAYNTEKYIVQALESVLNQTERDLEILVIDDGSQDATATLVQNFTDPRIKLLKNDRNRGLRYTLNHGLDQATGEWVALLDADDWFSSPQRLENLLAVAEDYQADLVADNQYFIRDGAEQHYSTLFAAGEPFFKPRVIEALEFLQSNIKPASQSPHYGLLKPMIKGTFLKDHALRYDESISNTGDLHFYMLCLIRGGRWVLVPEAYYYYRRNRFGSNTSRPKLKRLHNKQRLCHLLLEEKNTSHIPQLTQAIQEFLAKIEKDIKYHRAIQPLKEGGVKKLVTTLVSNPQFLGLLISQFPRMLKRQMNSYAKTVKS